MHNRKWIFFDSGIYFLTKLSVQCSPCSWAEVIHRRCYSQSAFKWNSVQIRCELSQSQLPLSASKGMFLRNEWNKWMNSVRFRPAISVRSASTRPVISTTLPRSPLHSAALPNITGKPMSERLTDCFCFPRLTATRLLLTFNGIFVKEEFLVQIVQYHFVIAF